MTNPVKTVIALDLEGTLISNAMSCFPRPGLRVFLDTCRSRFDRVVLFTAVDAARVRAIVEVLAGEGSVPSWFADCEIVAWSGPHKDIRFIPEADIVRTLLVDDLEAYVHPDQKQRWIPIKAFDPPYDDGDRELERIARLLSRADIMLGGGR